MTPEVVRVVVACVAEGLTLASAARVAGVSPDAARQLRHRDSHFSQQVDSAEAECQRRLWLRIVAHSANTWQAAAWCLERRWPEDFAKRELPPVMPDLGEPDFRFE